MLDIKWIRENQKDFDSMLAKRGLAPRFEEIIKLDQEKRALISQIQDLQHQRNSKSALLSNKNLAAEERQQIKNEVSLINEELEDLNQQLISFNELQDILDILPNILDDSVPYGTDENMNAVIRSVNTMPEISANYEHFELGANLGMMDFVQTAKFAGSRFVTLSGDLARLERALINFMLDVHTQDFDFLEISPPYMVKPQAMYNAGQLPKFAAESFLTTNDYRLIPTGEVSLVNMVSDMIIAREKLPIRYAAYTPCFRSEAGSAGKDTKGMIRLHQFGKVELVSITTPEESTQEHEYILNSAEEILKRLNLHYRVVLLCSGDTGFHSSKTYDLEVWLPGQKKYREISSCSNCLDFQARRMKARYKEFGASNTSFVHTLNGSGLAVGRTIVAILENYQNADGTITVPEVLVDYMGGREIITLASE